MYAICNVYTGQGAHDLYKKVFASSAEIEELLRRIPGFVSYTNVRTDEGGYSLVVVENPADLEEVGRTAGAFLKSLATELGIPIDPPTSTLKGEVGLHL